MSAHARRATPAASNPEPPDTSYWTAYDHFMAERDARLMRQAHVHAMIASLWRALRARIAGARREGAHRRAAAH